MCAILLNMIKKTKEHIGELIYGIHPLIEVLKAKRRKVISVYTTKPEPKAWKNVQDFWPKYHVPIQYVSRDVLARMAGGTTDHQGVVAWVQEYHYRKQFFDAKKQPFLVMLDGIKDTRNVGAILRSAHCTGVTGVIMVKRDAAPLNASAMKASAGLAEHLEIYQAPSPQAAIIELKKAGYTTYLATLNGKSATEVTYKEPLCIVIGSEGFGVSREIMNDGIAITLPQKNDDISYNASVAAGILLFLVGSKLSKI
ncbi:MAG: RNA methyltransferase [Candidatus Dependentiae bacterium]|nr:RNA methyltransferase [Candidatus Dependentiae bacterium]